VTGLFNLKTVAASSIDYVCSKIYPVLGSNFSGVINKGGTCTSESNCLVPSLTPTRTPTPTPTKTRAVIPPPTIYDLSLKQCIGSTCEGGVINCAGEPGITLYSTNSSPITYPSSIIYYTNSSLTNTFNGVVKQNNNMYVISNGIVTEYLGVDGTTPC
jgi:hypothetical protein